MDFFRRRFPSSELRELGRDDIGEDVKDERSPDRRLICSALLSKKVLNSLGANSGCSLAGTQKSVEASSSDDVGEGTVGVAAGVRDGRSGSPAACTSMDILRSACRLLNS